jgi:hypothetical protein
MSDADIEKGASGLVEVRTKLAGMKVAISCLTPENLSAPWILYEAGALSKTIDDRSRLCTLLIANLGTKDVPNPLGMFQHTVLEKGDIWKLIQTLNNAMGEDAVAPEIVQDAFETTFWPRLDDRIKELPPYEGPEPPKRDTEDMLAELLDYARENANRRKDTEWVDQWVPTLKQMFPMLAQALNQMKPPAPYKPESMDPAPDKTS